MKFVIFVFALCFSSVSYGQFETVPIDTLETIEVRSSILAQVQVCEYCSLIPISYETEMVSEKQKLFNRERTGRERGGRLRQLLDRLFNRKSKSKSCSG